MLCNVTSINLIRLKIVQCEPSKTLATFQSASMIRSVRGYMLWPLWEIRGSIIMVVFTPAMQQSCVSCWQLLHTPHMCQIQLVWYQNNHLPLTVRFTQTRFPQIPFFFCIMASLVYATPLSCTSSCRLQFLKCEQHLQK